MALLSVATWKFCLLVGCFRLNIHAAAQAPQKWEDKVDENGRKVQSLQIQAPAMTEEDQYGYIMPDRYRCDSCRAVIHQLNGALQRTQLKSRRLQEWEVHDIFDGTCKNGFKGYGITLVGGENVLNGPGLDRKAVEPGMGAIQMGGETWEKRLGEICRKFVYDTVGEDELYDNFLKNGNVSQELCFKETRDCQGDPLAPPKATTAGKKSPEKKGKKQVSQKKAVTQTKQKKDVFGDISAENGVVDMYSFLTKLASEHGVPASEYTHKRSYQEWRQMLVRTAGRVFEQSGAQGDRITRV